MFVLIKHISYKMFLTSELFAVNINLLVKPSNMFNLRVKVNLTIKNKVNFCNASYYRN